MSGLGDGKGMNFQFVCFGVFAVGSCLILACCSQSDESKPPAQQVTPEGGQSLQAPTPFLMSPSQRGALKELDRTQTALRCQEANPPTSAFGNQSVTFVSKEWNEAERTHSEPVLIKNCIFGVESIAIGVERPSQQQPDNPNAIGLRVTLKNKDGGVPEAGYDTVDVMTDCVGQVEMHVVDQYKKNGWVVTPQFQITLMNEVRTRSCPAFITAVVDKVLEYFKK